MELLGHVTTLCLTFWVMAELLSIAAAPSYIPISNAWWFQFLPIFTNILLLCEILVTDILLGLEWYLVVVLTCISLMTNDGVSFHELIGHLYVFFGEMSNQII